MASIFKRFQVEIDDDLPSRFPSDLDFEKTLKRICGEVDVEVDILAGRRDEKAIHSFENGKTENVTTIHLQNHSSNNCLNQGTKASMNISLEDKSSNQNQATEHTFNARTIGEMQHQEQQMIPNGKAIGDTTSGAAKKTYILKGQWEPMMTVHTQLASALSRCRLKDRETLSKEDDKTTRPRRAIKRKKHTEGMIGFDEFDSDAEENNNSAQDVESPSPVGRGRVKRVGGRIDVKKKLRGRSVSRGTKASSILVKRKKNLTEEHGNSPALAVKNPESKVPKKRGRPKSGRTEWACDECGFVGPKRSTLRSHRLRMHLGSPTQCDICGKEFPNKRYMLRHRVTHVAPQHCCDICGKTYKVRNSLIDHRKTHEADYTKEKVQCDLCPKSFCNRYVLECHIRDIHLGQKKSYLCSECGKSFCSRNSLKEHIDAHEGVRPHKCEVCGKSFSYKTGLRDHKYTHRESKQFWCHICQKGFSQRSGLLKHKRIHGQEKNYQCPTCHRSFTQKHAVVRHQKVHKNDHKKQDYNTFDGEIMHASHPTQSPNVEPLAHRPQPQMELPVVSAVDASSINVTHVVVNGLTDHAYNEPSATLNLSYPQGSVKEEMTLVMSEPAASEAPPQSVDLSAYNYSTQQSVERYTTENVHPSWCNVQQFNMQ